MFLAESRAVLEQFAPGLDAVLARHGLSALEAMEPYELKALMRDFGLPALWVPRTLGGGGISPYDGIRIQRAVGARSPSMAVMLTMHNFTVSFSASLADSVPPCAEMLRQVAADNLLVASAFAEGRYGAGILDSTVYVTRDGDGFKINGSKKPCTMAHCMDIITVGVAELCADGRKRTGMAILTGDYAGVSRHSFWNVPLLAAADNHELRFENVRVNSDQILLAGDDDADFAQIVAVGEVIGLSWFEIVATASYLGAASALAERVLSNQRIDSHERALLGSELEAAQATLDGAVRLMETASPDQSLLARVLLVRFAVQRVIERCAMHAAELAGGLAFVRDTEIIVLLAASRCLAFHPISRKAAEPMLAAWLAGLLGESEPTSV
jgi:alkylation response protein AidB-like acyl-CoA dehydrogenase